MNLHVQYVMSHYGYVGVFFILLMEMIGIPFPAETTLTISGFEWMKGTFSLLPLLLSAWLGNVLGSTIAFGIGYFLGRPVIVRFGRYVGITEARLRTADARFSKYRNSVILFGKFIAGIRILIPYLAGINRMPFLVFSVYNAISALVWTAFFIIIGRYIAVVWSHYSNLLNGNVLSIVCVLVVLAIAAIVIRRKRRKQRSCALDNSR